MELRSKKSSRTLNFFPSTCSNTCCQTAVPGLKFVKMCASPASQRSKSLSQPIVPLDKSVLTDVGMCSQGFAVLRHDPESCHLRFVQSLVKPCQVSHSMRSLCTHSTSFSKILNKQRRLSLEPPLISTAFSSATCRRSFMCCATKRDVRNDNKVTDVKTC